jgi:hypothetical protein
MVLTFAFGANAQYCTPIFFQGCSFGSQINTFKITGVSSTAINDLSTGCSPAPNYYLDNHTTMSVTLNQGAIYVVSANSGSISLGTDYIQIWIDFNDNFTFASSESVGGGGPMSGTLGSYNITIPATATLGTHRMRAVVSGQLVYPALNACPTFTADIWGEVHDYNVVITGTSSSTCPPVTGLTASAITSSSATISWTAATGATGYEWSVTTSSTPPASGTPTSLTSVPASGLPPATMHYAHVRTVCSTGSSTWMTIPFTTLSSSTTCPPVTGLTASAITSSSATISWSAATGATGYEWAVTTSATAPASGTPTTLLSVSASGLPPATAHYAHVRTNCGTSGYSTWVSIPFTTLATSTCPAITGLAASAITATSATVSWAAISTGSLGYQYVIDNLPTDPTGSGTNTTATSTSPTGLTAGTTYYAHVRDSCGVGNFSAWNTIPFTTTSTTCNAPTGLAASAITQNSATISWTNATGAIRAQWVVNTTAPDPTAAGTSTAATSVVKTGLTAATLYYAHVRDSCAAGLSAWVTIPFTTLMPSGIVDPNSDNFSIAVYPNPVKDILTIQLNGGTENAHILLTDIAGKTIRTINVTGNTVNVETNNLPAGMYLLKYTDAGHMQTVKVTKQ